MGRPLPDSVLNEEELRSLLKAEIDASGSYEAWARAHGVSRETARLVATGKLSPNKRILKALRVDRDIAYVVRG